MNNLNQIEGFLILDKLNDGIVILNSDKIVCYANNAAIQLLKVNKKSFVHSEFGYPVLKQGYNEVSVLDKNAAKILELSFKEINWRKKDHILVTIKDITKQKHIENIELYRELFDSESDALFLIENRSSKILKANKALKESQRKLSVLMSNLPGMAYRCKNNEVYTMLFVSDGCKELTGYEPDELINNNKIIYGDLIHQDDKDRIWNEVQNALMEKQQFQLEYKIITKCGKEKWVWEKGIGIVSKNGKVDHLEGFISDISELKKVEEELTAAKERAERSDQLKFSFLANMSHEIRTPMNGIVGFSNLLLKENLEHEQRIKYVNIINNSSKQLLSIIGDILDISRIETGNVYLDYREFSIKNLLNEIYDSFQFKVNEKGLKLIKKFDFKDDTKNLIKADRTKVQQIISNLLMNAYKFTEEGHIMLGCRDRKNEYLIYVSDTGIGISKQSWQTIFNRFNKGEIDYTNKYGGTGLGLSISKAYIEMMGGNIWVESEPGKGSCFYITLSKNRKTN